AVVGRRRVVRGPGVGGAVGEEDDHVLDAGAPARAVELGLRLLEGVGVGGPAAALLAANGGDETRGLVQVRPRLVVVRELDHGVHGRGRVVVVRRRRVTARTAARG